MIFHRSVSRSSLLQNEVLCCLLLRRRIVIVYNGRGKRMPHSFHVSVSPFGCCLSLIERVLSLTSSLAAFVSFPPAERLDHRFFWIPFTLVCLRFSLAYLSLSLLASLRRHTLIIPYTA